MRLAKEVKKIHKYVKTTLIILAVIIALVLVWYATVRIISSSYAVKSYELSLKMADFAFLDKSTLSIGSFNIAHARGGKTGASNWQDQTKEEILQHLRNIASQIEDAQLDVIVLNEVDFSSTWSFNVNQASYIAEQAGYPYVVEQKNMDISFPFYEFKFGNAILSRYPVVESNSIVFSPYSKWEAVLAGNHNGVLSILQTPLGRVGVVAIHLEYRSEEIRVQAANQIKSIGEKSEFPIVAAGDFNSTPITFSGAEITSAGLNALSCLLGQAGFQAPSIIKNETEHFTFPTQKPLRIIDWILEKGRLQTIDWRVVRSNLSDHFLVTSVLKVNDDDDANKTLQTITPSAAEGGVMCF